MRYLNIVTPLIRAENLEKIYNSIPKEEDVHWIIIKHKDLNIDDFVKTIIGGISLVTVVSCDFEEGLHNLHRKMTMGYVVMKPGMYHGLDDDNEYWPDAYNIFKEYPQYKFILGKQPYKLPSGQYTHEAQPPERGVTDGAQAMIDVEIVKQNAIGNLKDDPCADGTFLVKCWDACKHEERMLVDRQIATYNTLRC